MKTGHAVALVGGILWFVGFLPPFPINLILWIVATLMVIGGFLMPEKSSEDFTQKNYLTYDQDRTTESQRSATQVSDVNYSQDGGDQGSIEEQGKDDYDKIEELHYKKEEGSITKGEFNRKKNELLGGSPSVGEKNMKDGGDKYDKIEEMFELKKEGILEEEKYQEIKSKLLTEGLSSDSEAIDDILESSDSKEEKLLCPNCEEEIEKDWNVCSYCGTNLKSNCLNCGEEIEEDWTTCPYCGNEINNV